MAFEKAQLAGAVPDQILAARDAASKQFMDAFEMKYEPGKGVITGGESSMQRHRLASEKWQHLYKLGWENAIVINCLPWALEIHTNYGYYRIPAPDKKKGEALHTYEIRVPAMSMRDMGDANYIPEPVMPIEIAQEFERKYRDEGGVIAMKCPAVLTPEFQAEVGKRVAEAHEKMNAWYKNQFLQGQRNWSQFNKNPFHISDRMRDAARFLYETGGINELPDWVSVTREESVHSECPACAEVVRKAAKVCKHCGFKIDAEFVKQNADRFEKKKEKQ